MSTRQIFSKSMQNFRYKIKKKKKIPNLLNISIHREKRSPETLQKDFFLTLQKKSEKNSSSLSFTHHNYLTVQTDQTKVMKLSLWDKENLTSKKENDKNLYNTLSSFYRSKNNIQSQKELEKYNNLLETKSKFNNFIQEASLNTNNKILLDFINRGKKEQGSILYNSISKTKSRFDFFLFNEKNQKDFQTDLNIDSTTLNAIKNEKIGNDYYRKVIREKMQQEATTREEVIAISKKVFEKKRERIDLENKLTELYEQKNEVISIFNEKKNKLKKDLLNFHQQFEEQQVFIKTLSKMDQLVKFSKATAHNNELEHRIEVLTKDYEKKIGEFNRQKDEIIKEINIVRKEENFFKKVSNELIKDQRLYYLDILKKGYDVRSEGLVWVIRNLLEMQTNLEYHHFPKFLTNQHCDYLIEMADICLEEAQLKIVLKAVKNKQMKIKNEENIIKFNKIVDYATKESSKITNAITNPGIINKYKESGFYNKKEKTITEKLFEMFNKIYEKHEEAFKFSTEKRNEEIKLEKVQKRIKETLLEKGARKTDNYQSLNEILHFIEQNENSKGFLEIILNIRARLNYLSKYKEKLKNDQLTLFKLSQNSNKRFTNAKSSLQYDLIFSALFGCNIQI